MLAESTWLNVAAVILGVLVRCQLYSPVAAAIRDYASWLEDGKR
ncbi:MAG TPA: hypothetical protein VHT04_18825 [Stellaceae bacterium]|jgi:hypothetical protein|nr:hypothetical protein [Stellaceae bacterium]